MPSPATPSFLNSFSQTLIPMPQLITAVSLPFHHRRRCSSSSSNLFIPRSAISSSSYQNSSRQQESIRDDDDDDYEDEEDELVIGDCLVFEDGAFDDSAAAAAAGYPVGHRRLASPPLELEKRRRRRPLTKKVEVRQENLVPERWKEAVEEINISKKDKRRIAHELRFGSRMERRKKSSVPDMEEYRAYRDMKLAQLRPVVLDQPLQFPKAEEPQVVEEEEEEEEHKMTTKLPEKIGRVAPKNPRVELGSRTTVEDITDFFNSNKYAPQEVDDDKKPQGKINFII